jgi:hypothetical protein
MGSSEVRGKHPKVSFRELRRSWHKAETFAGSLDLGTPLEATTPMM